MLMKHHPKNIQLKYIYIYQFYNWVPSLEQSIGYNHENNFVHTLNAVFKVITFLGENWADLYNIFKQQFRGAYLNARVLI